MPTTIYAATEGNGVYKTDNNGLSWSPMPGGLDAPGAKDVRAIMTSGATVYAGTGAGLFKSVGGGWTPVAQGAEEDPKNPKKLNASVQALLSSGGSMLAGVASGGVYKSSDGGATWKPPAPGNGMVRSETVWSLTEFLPGIVFAATQSGVYRSTDAGSTWTLVNDGITGTVLRVFKDEKAPNIYYAAGHDGVFRTDQRRRHVVEDQRRQRRQRAGRHRPRDEAAQRRRPHAPVRRHPERRLRRHHRPRARFPARSSGARSPRTTTAWATTRSSGRCRTSSTTPGTLLAGTQSNGGYMLTFTPAINTVDPDDQPAARPTSART